MTYSYDPMEFVDGHLYSQKMIDLNEILQDYNDRLSLMWIPPDKRAPEDARRAYAVVHEGKDFQQYVVCYASEMDQPHEILAKVIFSDSKHGSVLERVDANNLAQKLMDEKRRYEERMLMKEQVEKMLKDKPKNRIHL